MSRWMSWKSCLIFDLFAELNGFLTERCKHYVKMLMNWLSRLQKVLQRTLFLSWNQKLYSRIFNEKLKIPSTNFSRYLSQFIFFCLASIFNKIILKAFSMLNEELPSIINDIKRLRFPKNFKTQCRERLSKKNPLIDFVRLKSWWFLTNEDFFFFLNKH